MDVDHDATTGGADDVRSPNPPTGITEPLRSGRKNSWPRSFTGTSGRPAPDHLPPRAGSLGDPPRWIGSDIQAEEPATSTAEPEEAGCRARYVDDPLRVDLP